jgi:YD repeat-containing protein
MEINESDQSQFGQRFLEVPSSMRGIRYLKFGCSLFALSIGNVAYAAETVAYSYDSQGRLVQTSTSGTVNNGNSTVTTFDAPGTL